MKLALLGYGKMGKEIEKIAVEKGHQIVLIIDINNQDELIVLERIAIKGCFFHLSLTNIVLQIPFT